MKPSEERTIGGDVIEPGNTEDYYTGGWRKLKPVFDKEKCIHCLTCWVMCPDSCVVVTGEKMTGFEMKHCKGCGICAAVCPDKVKAIKMEEEVS